MDTILGCFHNLVMLMNLTNHMNVVVGFPPVQLRISAMQDYSFGGKRSNHIYLQDISCGQ